MPAVAMATDRLTWLSRLPATSTWKMSCPSSWGLWGRGGLRGETGESQRSGIHPGDGERRRGKHPDGTERVPTGETLNANQE